LLFFLANVIALTAINAHAANNAYEANAPVSVFGSSPGFL
jgi:hypothetical protein